MKILRTTVSALVLATVACLGLWQGMHRRTEVDAVAAITGPTLPGSLVASRQPTPIDETTYFESISQLVQDTYVEPNVDPRKLAIGAVRGMVAALRDVDCRFFDPNQYRVVRNAQRGRYEGIGVEVVFEDSGGTDAGAIGQDSENEGMPPNPIPRAVIGRVVPGSAAERAGLRPGDVLDSIDGKWVVSADELQALQELQKKVLKGEATPKELNLRREELRKRLQSATMPLRAMDRLMTGTEGVVDVRWRRDGKEYSAKIEKGTWSMPVVAQRPDGSIVVRFAPGCAEMLKEVLGWRAQATLDLRGESNGDFAAMRQALAVVAPSGTYGKLVRSNPEQKATDLVVQNGNPKAPKLTILVDRHTSGAAEIFALALSQKGATLKGTQMAGDARVIETVPLPDGGAYTLVTAKFQVAAGKGGAK
ncbi:MAG: S41 family peptidase [Fimbriimonadaceae bacterium]